MRIDRNLLLLALDSVSPGLSAREIIEQSSCIAFQGKQVLTYNDEIACRHEVELDIEGAVKAAPLLSILRKMQDNEIDVSLSENGDAFVIKGKGGRKTSLVLQQDVLLPVEHLEDPEEWEELPTEFSEAIRSVADCASGDQSMFVLTCIHIGAKFVETCDRHKMARRRIALPVSGDICVRKNSLLPVCSLGVTEVSESDNWIHFRNKAGLIYSCRKSTDDYPDLNGFVSRKGPPATLPKGLGEAAERCAIFTADNPNGQEVMIELRKGKLRISGEGAHGTHSEIKKLAYKGRSMRFLISPATLKHVTDKYHDCMITDDKDESFLVIRSGALTFVTLLGLITE